jgi:hypothetical protein
MATMATGDDDDDGDDDDGATTTDDVGDGGMGAATGYDDDDAFDGCGIFQWRWTKARWWGQREMQQSKNRGNGGSGGNKRSFTDSHLKDLHAVFVQNEMVPRA